MVSKIYIGTVVGSEIAVNRNGENDVRILSAEMSSADDVQSVELISQNGEQTNPNDDSGVVILELGPSWKIAIATRDNVEPDSGLQRGEKIIYSLDSSNQIKAKIYLRSDGSVYVGDGDDFVAMAGKVLTELQAIKSAFDSHIHTTTATVGAGATPGVISVPSNGATPPVPEPMPDPSAVASSNLKADE